jgi:hypothetical protein
VVTGASSPATTTIEISDLWTIRFSPITARSITAATGASHRTGIWVGADSHDTNEFLRSVLALRHALVLGATTITTVTDFT